MKTFFFLMIIYLNNSQEIDTPGTEQNGDNIQKLLQIGQQMIQKNKQMEQFAIQQNEQSSQTPEPQQVEENPQEQIPSRNQQQQQLLIEQQQQMQKQNEDFEQLQKQQIQMQQQLIPVQNTNQFQTKNKNEFNFENQLDKILQPSRIPTQQMPIQQMPIQQMPIQQNNLLLANNRGNALSNRFEQFPQYQNLNQEISDLNSNDFSNQTNNFDQNQNNFSQTGNFDQNQIFQKQINNFDQNQNRFYNQQQQIQPVIDPSSNTRIIYEDQNTKSNQELQQYIKQLLSQDKQKINTTDRLKEIVLEPITLSSDQEFQNLIQFQQKPNYQNQQNQNQRNQPINIINFDPQVLKAQQSQISQQQGKDFNFQKMIQQFQNQTNLQVQQNQPTIQLPLKTNKENNNHLANLLSNFMQQQQRSQTQQNQQNQNLQSLSQNLQQLISRGRQNQNQNQKQSQQILTNQPAQGLNVKEIPKIIQLEPINISQEQEGNVDQILNQQLVKMLQKQNNNQSYFVRNQ